MINLDLIKQYNKIKVIKRDDGFLSIKPLDEDEIDRSFNEFVSYIKVHSPFENIRALIKQFSNRKEVCEEMGILLIDVLNKIRKDDKQLNADDHLFEIEIGMAMKAEIILENSRSISDWKISESFVYDLLNRLDQESTVLSSAIYLLGEFMSTQEDSKKREKEKFSNPEIAMAYNLLYVISKKPEYRITEKNAAKILKAHSKGSKSVIVFMRTVSENTNIENMKKCHEANKTSATRKRESLFRVKELLIIIDKSNNKARIKIDEIIRDYLESYKAIY